MALAACSALPAGLLPPPAPEPVTPGRQCLAALNLQGIVFRTVAMPPAPSACHVENPVEITSTGATWDMPGVVSCDFALRVESFTREVVEPLARERFGQKVVRLHQAGAYVCQSTRLGNVSQHASGNAIDLTGVDLADGMTITIAHDWAQPGPKSDFLHEIARRACFYFMGILTPDAAPDNAGHIHLDAGPRAACDKRQ
jgi:hypothetical protein